MADYRLSAQVISRGKGQSSIASAAYRSASRLLDERTGEIHNYDRKAGVTHAEVMTPEGTPDWMHDRAQLWNAVEAVERRKDAQLAREVQLSLPHELTDAQRLDLVRGFVQEQFVDRGMIADVAIHAPSEKGDQRNHHAHVMLTMRSLTADGFGQKARDWNSPELLEQWREQWAHHQNRTLERHGHSERVDHRSYEAQGIDREPSQHLGYVATDMERNGKASRIGDENRAIANDNADRAADHMALAEIAREKWKFGKWAEYKRSEIEAAQDLASLDLSQKHDRQKSWLAEQIRKENASIRATLTAEVQAIDRRLQAAGIRKVLRDVFGRTKTDSQTRQKLQASLADMDKREKERMAGLERKQAAERVKEARRQSKNRDRLEKGIQTARERREADDWKPRTSQRGTKRTGRPERQKTAKPAPTPASRSKQPQKPAPEVRPSDAPDLATKKRSISPKLDEKHGDLKRPWERSSLTQSSERPWERDGAPRRERVPPPPNRGGKK